MQTLDTLFNAPATDRIPNPTVKFDWKAGQTIKFRLATNMSGLKLLIRHFVEGVGYVRCNQAPFKKKSGGFGLWGDCVFCKVRKDAKEAAKARALAEGRTELTKDEQKTVDQVMKRQILLIGAVEVEIKRGREVVKPLEAKAIQFRASDMFFDQLTQHYKVLSAVEQNDGDLNEFWFTLDGKGTLLRNDRVTADDLERPIEVDLAFFDKQTKAYEVGAEKYGAQAKAVEEAEPLIEEDDEEIAF